MSKWNMLFSSESYMPHGYCFLWDQKLVWMHVISDIAIALAYFSIPLTISILLRNKKIISPYNWVLALFALFIFFCGVTHLIELLTLWYPYYYLEGVIKVITAAVSISTAILIYPLVPAILERFESENKKEDKASDE